MAAAAGDDPVDPVRELYAAFSAQSPARIEAVLSPDVEWTFHAPEHVIPYAGVHHGRDGVAQFFAGVARTIDVIAIGQREFLVSGNVVTVPGWERARARSTGGEYVANWVHQFTVEDGLITRFEEFTDSGAIMEAMAPADADRGRAYFTTCAGCHGLDGGGDENMQAPNLTLQGGEYLLRQLRHFRAQVRGGVQDTYGWMMNGRALALPGDRPLRDVVAYIATLPARRAPPGGDTGPRAGGELYVSSCASCHGGPSVAPTNGAPPLAGLQDWYLLRQLQNFKSGVRGSHADDAAGVQMRAAVMTLGDAQLRAVAAYAAGMP